MDFILINADNLHAREVQCKRHLDYRLGGSIVTEDKKKNLIQLEKQEAKQFKTINV